MGQASWGHRDLPVSISLELANKYASPRPDFLGAGDITQDLTLGLSVSLACGIFLGETRHTPPSLSFTFLISFYRIFLHHLLAYDVFTNPLNNFCFFTWKINNTLRSHSEESYYVSLCFLELSCLVPGNLCKTWRQPSHSCGSHHSGSHGTSNSTELREVPYGFVLFSLGYKVIVSTAPKWSFHFRNWKQLSVDSGNQYQKSVFPSLLI